MQGTRSYPIIWPTKLSLTWVTTIIGHLLDHLVSHIVGHLVNLHIYQQCRTRTPLTAFLASLRRRKIATFLPCPPPRPPCQFPHRPPCQPPWRTCQHTWIEHHKPQWIQNGWWNDCQTREVANFHFCYLSEWTRQMIISSRDASASDIHLCNFHCHFQLISDHS